MTLSLYLYIEFSEYGKNIDVEMEIYRLGEELVTAQDGYVYVQSTGNGADVSHSFADASGNVISLNDEYTAQLYTGQVAYPGLDINQARLAIVCASHGYPSPYNVR